jgi:prevent-host-death family protein
MTKDEGRRTKEDRVKEITVTQARPKLAELIRQAARGKRYIIAKKGKRNIDKAVLVGLDEFEGMRRQLEFRRLVEDTRTQARAAIGLEQPLDDEAAMELADRVIQEIRKERHARRLGH